MENYCIQIEFKLVLKTTYKKLALKYQDNARFPSLCLASENAFLSYFYSKNGHNSVENYCIRKKFKLVLTTTYKKLFLKYQVNAWFPSLCLASENTFLSYFYSINGHNSVENYCFGKKFKLVLKTTYKKFVLKYQDNARFPSLCLASENAFLSYFYSKNGHISVENHHIGKKSKLVLKTTSKKLFLKYQDNARFPSLCLASENAFLSYIFTQKMAITR